MRRLGRRMGFRRNGAPPEGDAATQHRNSARQANQRNPRRQILVTREGSPNIERIGAHHSHWRDLYHLWLTMPWPVFLGLTIGLYLSSNLVFALAYLLGGDCIANARPGSLLDAFFFSVQTMATIGYGAMYPKTDYANMLVAIEALVGLLGVAMITGLMFARFSRPTARVLFSRVAVVAPHNGVPMLMFRAANQRGNQILEARLWVTLVRDEVTIEGASMRRLYDLKLVRSQTPFFFLTWTAMHPIDADSPLYGETAASLAEQGTVILVTLTGIDETVAQTVHARHSFSIEEILWDRRFKDLFSTSTSGLRVIDYRHFHDVEPLEYDLNEESN